MSVAQAAAVEVRDLRIDLIGRGIDVVDEISLEIRAGRSARAGRRVRLRARRRSAWRCSATCRRGGQLWHGAVIIGGRDLAQPRRRRGCGGCAAARSPTSRRTPAPRSTRRCGCACSCARCSTRTPAPRRRGARRPHARGARGGRAAVRRHVPGPLPAPALRRPAAARRDRDGVRLPAERDRLRRADDGPRRDHAGARAGDRARPLPDPRRRGALRQPRPGGRRRAGRSRRGDVRRADRRGRHARPAVHRAAPPVHPAAAAGRARPGGQARGRRHPRPRPAARQPAGGVLLPRRAARWRRGECRKRVPACVRGWRRHTASAATTPTRPPPRCRSRAR